MYFLQEINILDNVKHEPWVTEKQNIRMKIRKFKVRKYQIHFRFKEQY